MAKLSMHLASMAMMAMLLVGCARPMGDFGRAAPSPLHDEILPAIAAKLMPRSSFNLTDEEKEMRDRVWRYLVAPHAYDWFGATLTELQRTGLVPLDRKPLPIDRYYIWLHGETFASSRTRYARLADDVSADIEMMPDSFRAICAVLEIDNQRDVAAARVDGIEDRTREDVAAARSENDKIIGWFVKSAGSRYDSYSYALNHLLVETPHHEAVQVDGLLSTLAIDVEIAQRGDFCAMPAAEGRQKADVTTRSRYVRGSAAGGS